MVLQFSERLLVNTTPFAEELQYRCDCEPIPKPRINPHNIHNSLLYTQKELINNQILFFDYVIILRGVMTPVANEITMRKSQPPLVGYKQRLSK